MDGGGLPGAASKKPLRMPKSLTCYIW